MTRNPNQESIGADWPWEMLVHAQAGVVMYKQARDHGFSARQIGYRVTSGKWRQIYHGIYATFTGDLPWEARLWAVVLAAGKGSMLSHETAASLQQLAAQRKWPIHVIVPSNRHPSGKPMRGVIVHRSDQSRCDGVAPWKLPRTQIDDTVLDLAAASRTADDAYTWTTSERSASTSSMSPRAPAKAPHSSPPACAARAGPGNHIGAANRAAPPIARSEINDLGGIATARCDDSAKIFSGARWERQRWRERQQRWRRDRGRRKGAGQRLLTPRVERMA